MAQITETPLMKQYREMKTKHPDAIVLMCVGDFYETFGDDAIAVSEICGVTLTRRANGKSASIELAGFPHHALDTYLPKIIRAGKRVAICEQLDNSKQKVVEKVTPAQTEEPKQEPKPEKKMTTKEINCKLTTEQMRDLGEPIAYFTMALPKEAKNLGKQTDKNRPNLAGICIEPENDKIIASDTKILSTLSVECYGVWPKSNDGKPFQCNIDPKAINALAGKQVDVAVWADNVGKLVVTACEAVGVRSQYQEGKIRFPDYKRVIPSDAPYRIRIADKDIPLLRSWLKENMGKKDKSYDGYDTIVRINLCKEADSIMLRTYRLEYGELKESSDPVYFDLVEYDPKANIQLNFFAPLMYLCVEGDFDGRIEIKSDNSPIKTLGKYRESIIVPVYSRHGYCTESDNPETEYEASQRIEREKRERADKADLEEAERLEREANENKPF